MLVAPPRCSGPPDQKVSLPKGNPAVEFKGIADLRGSRSESGKGPGWRPRQSGAQSLPVTSRELLGSRDTPVLFHSASPVQGLSQSRNL